MHSLPRLRLDFLSIARMRSRQAFRCNWKEPRRDFPQLKVKTKNAKVSGLPMPRFFPER